MNIRIHHNHQLILLTNDFFDFARYGSNTIATKVNNEKEIDFKALITRETKKAADVLGFLYECDDVAFAQHITYFFNKIPKITAAGGAVLNTNNEVLLIKRLGKWDLPKGKLEVNETLETCALREIAEETGQTQLTLNKYITTTYHTYLYKNQLVVKESYWYKVTCNKVLPMVVQTEEGIETAEWVNQNNMHIYLKNTYETIKTVLKGIE